MRELPQFNFRWVTGRVFRSLKAAEPESHTPHKFTLFLRQQKGRLIKQKPSRFCYYSQGKQKWNEALFYSQANFFSSCHISASTCCLIKPLVKEQQNPLLCFVCKRAVISWSCLYPTPFTLKLPMSPSASSRTQKNSYTQKRNTTNFKGSIWRSTEWEREEEGEEQSILLFIFHRWVWAWPDVNRHINFFCSLYHLRALSFKEEKEKHTDNSLQEHHAELLLQLPDSFSSDMKCKEGLPPTWPGTEPNALICPCSF